VEIVELFDATVLLVEVLLVLELFTLLVLVVPPLENTLKTAIS
jgi:hypothetical protein